VGKVRILNSSGDTLLVEGEAGADVGGRRVDRAEAERLVREHVAQGGLAYTKKGDEKEQVKDYDPLAEETVLAPRMQGGC
jgi:hypothetical protein